MRLSSNIITLLLAVVAMADPSDYGPCDINGNEYCKEIMDNTACFLNPQSAEQIFKCISGGRIGVCLLVS